jgi:acetoin utilization deacetylase AcuC-like enzyme
MGFCVFNNVAVGATAALRVQGVRRVAIIDWDAHHGNGTEEVFRDRRNVLYASWHQSPFYPHTGDANHVDHEGAVHCRLAPGAGDAELLAGWHERVRPALQAFKPDLLLISAGFDADARDPLADLAVSLQGFRELTRRVVAFSTSHCSGRIVSVLEGGYDLRALAEDTVAHVEALLEN